MAVSYDFGPGMGQSLNLIGQSLSKSFPDQDTRNARERRELQLENAQHQATQIRIHEASINAMIPVMEEQAAGLAQGISNALTVGDYGTAFLRTASALKLFSGGEESDPFAKFRADLMTRGNGPQILAQFQGFHQTVMSQQLKLVDKDKSAPGTTVHQKDDDGEDVIIFVKDAIEAGKADDSISDAMYAKTTAPESRIKIAELFDKEIDSTNPNRLMGREETDNWRVTQKIKTKELQIFEHKVHRLSAGMIASGTDPDKAPLLARKILSEALQDESAREISLHNIRKKWKRLDGGILGEDEIAKVRANEKQIDRELRQENKTWGTVAGPELRKARLELLNESQGIGAKDGAPSGETRDKQMFAIFNDLKRKAAASDSATRLNQIEYELTAEFYDGKRNKLPNEDEIQAVYDKDIGEAKALELTKYRDLKKAKKGLMEVRNRNHPIYDVKGYISMNAAMQNLLDFKNKHLADNKYLSSEDIAEETGLDMNMVQLENVIQRWRENWEAHEKLLRRPLGERASRHAFGVDVIENERFKGTFENLSKEDRRRAKALMLGDNSPEATSAVNVTMGQLSLLTPFGIGVRQTFASFGVLDEKMDDYFKPELRLVDDLFALDRINRQDPEALKDLGMDNYFDALRNKFGAFIPLDEDSRGMTKRFARMDKEMEGLDVQIAAYEQERYIQQSMRTERWRDIDSRNSGSSVNYLRQARESNNIDHRGRNAMQQELQKEIFAGIRSSDRAVQQFALEQGIAAKYWPEGTTLAFDASGAPAIDTNPRR